MYDNRIKCTFFFKLKRTEALQSSQKTINMHLAVYWAVLCAKQTQTKTPSQNFYFARINSGVWGQRCDTMC